MSQQYYQTDLLRDYTLPSSTLSGDGDVSAALMERCETETAQISSLRMIDSFDRRAINAMRRECANCGTFWLPWLPLASSLAVPDFACIVAIRYRDAGWIWRPVRQSF